jgi:transcriptional antiterminator RfaH
MLSCNISLSSNDVEGIVTRRWYVAQTQAGREALAIQHLKRQGFEAFHPRFRKRRRHARRIDEVLAPVFPGYVFVRFDRERDQWRAVNGTIGVSRLLVATPNRPQPMPEAAMVALRARCQDDVMGDLVPDLRPGQVVRLISGPFAEQWVEIDRLDDRGRVLVLLNILGGTSRVDVPLRAIGTA